LQLTEPQIVRQSIASEYSLGFTPLVVNSSKKGKWSWTKKQTSVRIEPRLFSDVSSKENEGVAPAATYPGHFSGEESVIK